MNLRLFALVLLVVPHFIRASSSVAESLFEAAKQGNFEIVEELIQKGANVNHANQAGETALNVACCSGHVEVARLLIDNGAVVNHVSYCGNFPLICASFFGHLATVQLLIERGAYIDQVATVYHAYNHGRTALIEAALRGQVAVVRLLIEKGANVNHVDNFRNTALSSASFMGHDRAAQLLIENGADVNHVGKHGMTALTEAAVYGHLRIVEMLIKNGANLNHVDNFGKNALMCAASGGHLAIAHLLIQNGANVNHTNSHGWSALTHASRYKDVGNPSMCRCLILAGANTEGDNILNRETCVDPITAPLATIRNSVASHEAYIAVLPILNDSGIQPLQGFISFALESLKKQVDIFGDSEIISFLQDQGWDRTKIEVVKRVIHKLVELRCTEMNVFYVVAPFITSADDETFRRLVASLEFLTNAIPDLMLPNVDTDNLIASNGIFLNAMIHRSAHLGLRPVLKALYNIYWRASQDKRTRMRLRLPDEVLTLIDTFWEDTLGAYSNLENSAMAELETAIQRHHRPLESIDTMTTTTTMSFGDTEI